MILQILKSEILLKFECLFDVFLSFLDTIWELGLSGQQLLTGMNEIVIK